MRYGIIFDALSKHEAPPNLLSVVRWRRDMSDARRRDIRHLAMTEMTDASGHDPSSRAPRTLLRSSGMVRMDSADYASEASSLQWLPHLASLHSRFVHPTGRRDMKEWHATAQVVHDYVLHCKDPIPKPQAPPSPRRGPARSIASTASPIPSIGELATRATSLEIERLDPAAELERISSMEYTSNDGHKNQGQTSPRSSVGGFRISLTGLGRDPRRVFARASRPTSPSLDGPGSPPLNATEFSFSQTSSKANLSRKRIAGALSDGPGSPEMSMSEGVTDAEDALGGVTRTSSSRPDMLSASDDESRLRVGGGRSNKSRWSSPLFARRPTERRLHAEELTHSPISGPEETPEDLRRPALETHAFTADFLSQFPRADHADPQELSMRWEEVQRRQRDIYTEKQKYVHLLFMIDVEQM